MMKYIQRTMEQFFLKASGQFPVMLLTGARQVGKTTFLKHLAAESRSYVSLDDPMHRSLAREDPALFLQRFRPPLLIDEVQYAPQLLPLLKMVVDTEKQAGQYWLTGSQQFHLMKGVSESLAGRVGILNLLGFSQRELNETPVARPFLPTEKSLAERQNAPPVLLPALFERIWWGSFPALNKGEKDLRDFYYSSYVQTYLQRDVRDLAKVGDMGSFLRFLRVCAARTGQLLNTSDLCRDADISHPTGKRWLSILETSGVIFFLEPYHSNINKRLVKAPKLYFLDTGLASYLTEWSSPETLEAGAMSGAILETWVLAEILKSYWHNGKRAPLYFYRDKDKKEIDILIVQDERLFPVEIKKTASPTKQAVQHFRILDSLKKSVGEGCVISLCPQVLPITASVQAIPVGML